MKSFAAILAAAALAAALLAAPAAPALAQAGTAPAEVGVDALINDPTSPVLGNPKGDVTVVEFFDYQCPFCKRVHPDLKRLVEEDENVRLVMKEWAIFGPESEYAARAALASQWQNKYEAAQDALMRVDGKLSRDKTRAALEAAGVDLARLDRDLEVQKGTIDAVLASVNAQAEAMGFNGTPVFVVPPFVVPGAVDLAGLRQVVKDARAEAAKAKP